MRGETEIVVVERSVRHSPGDGSAAPAGSRRRYRRPAARRRRDQLRIDRQIGGGRQHQAVVEDVAAAAIFEVEIGMVREVAERRLVGGRSEFDRQRARNFQPVRAGDVERARKTHVPVGRMQRQRDESRRHAARHPTPVCQNPWRRHAACACQGSSCRSGSVARQSRSDRRRCGWRSARQSRPCRANARDSRQNARSRAPAARHGPSSLRSWSTAPQFMIFAESPPPASVKRWTVSPSTVVPKMFAVHRPPACCQLPDAQTPRPPMQTYLVSR